MAIRKIFSVFDSKAAAYVQPLFADTRALAVRMFQSAVCSSGHQFNMYAADFTLFEIGSFDDLSGLLQPLPAPEMVVSAHTLLATASNKE